MAVGRVSPQRGPGCDGAVGLLRRGHRMTLSRSRGGIWRWMCQGTIVVALTVTQLGGIAWLVALVFRRRVGASPLPSGF
ncbi:MAG: hypothetical protein B7Z10_10130 [Rhodobacterales bacterium 32-66-7]|nr:MAG: hypothetical protein B7Z10_10130 [Rhodobacterales bacterium 32-66-7]